MSFRICLLCLYVLKRTCLYRLLLWNLLEYCCQQFPERLCCSDLETLVDGVGAAERRTERDYLHVGVLLQDHRALQSGMIHDDRSVLAVLLFVDFAKQLRQRAVGIRVPTTIRTRELYLHASHREHALQLCSDVHLHILTAGASQDLDGGLPLTNRDDGEV